MTLYRSWLPADAIMRGARDLPLRAVVRAWSAKWFAYGNADISGDCVQVPSCDVDAGSTWSSDDGMMLAADAATPFGVAALMFGAVLDRNELTAADRTALESAADTCLADLRMQLGDAVGLDQPWRSGAERPRASTWWTVRVATGANKLLSIHVSEALVARHVRAALPPARPRVATGSLETALDPHPVEISARIGATRLTTSELAALGIGDLLVLDTALTGFARVAVNHRPQPLGCTVDPQDGHLRLVIV